LNKSLFFFLLPLKGSITNGQRTLEEMFSIPSHKGNAHQKCIEIHLSPVRMLAIKKTNDNKCWQRHVLEVGLLHTVGGNVN
jgi:hypothetical protein